MSTLYIKVLCSERLPCIYGHYDTDLGCLYFVSDGKWMCSLRIVYPSYWFEEITIPDEEYVERFITELQRYFKMKFDVETWKSGFNVALELLTGDKK